MKIVPAFFALMLLSPLEADATTPVHLPPTSGFVPNMGQAPPEVLYYAATPRGALYLTRDAVVLDTWESERNAPATEDAAIRRRGHAVWVRFSGSNPGAVVEGEDPL